MSSPKTSFEPAKTFGDQLRDQERQADAEREARGIERDRAGRIAGYRLRQKDGKRRAVDALHGLAFRVIAAGDSYNDTTMLAAADAGILFRPPENVIRDFPQFPVTKTYDELRQAFVDGQR